jgi:LysM repeat protein
VTSGGTSIRFSYDPTGLAIEGRIARGHPGVSRTVTVTDPANYAAAAFRNVLEEAGVVVHGGVTTVRIADASPVTGRRQAQGDGAGPPPRVIGTHLSPTLGEVATVTNHVSQNLFAEALFKTVGRVVIGEGTFAAGARAVLYFMECEKPVDFSGLHIVDGSGLSPENRVTARVTIHLLDLMTRTEVADVFRESLPMAASPRGGAHSLRNRMGGTPAANNLRAKTGTISNVSSLSGYVEAANGELLAFSIYVNGVPSTWTAKRMEDAVGVRLARFTRPEPASPIVTTAIEPESIGIDEDSAGAGSIDPIDESSEPSPTSPTTPAEPPIEAPAARTHRVASGESFDVIARRYGLTTAQLQAANPGIQPRRLQIGHTLTIPAGTGTSAPSETSSTARPATRTHRVASGETLDGIARRYGVTVSALQSVNGNVQPRRLQIGQTLVIPTE